MSADLVWALAQQRDRRRRARYALARDYYEGRHRLAFATARFDTVFADRLKEITDNLCPAVVDPVADRLRVTGFASSSTRRGRDPLAAQALAIWKRNRMGQRAAEVHRESLITGDGYAVVWPDADGNAAIWPQLADEFVVEYSAERPGELVRAARVWRDPRLKRLRVNLYFPDRTERYMADSGAASPTAAGLKPLEHDWNVANPYGRVPVFHFPNRRLFQYGVSELRDVIPLQDALNKAICDLMVAMEFSAYRQRWATGIDVEIDEETGRPKAPPFVPGPDRIFAVEDDNAEFGEFSETDLSQFLEVQENVRAEVARVSGTPLHYLFITRGDFPSGEAMKSAEARFSAKLEDQQESKGNTWEDALTFALTIEGARLPRGFELSTIWTTASPRSEEEIARTAQMKRQVGVPLERILRDDFGLSEEEAAAAATAAAASPPPAPPPAADAA